MASWTDGAAYAPLERPDGFATPEAEPLATATPASSGTPGAVPRPREFVRSAPEVPLGGVRTSPLPRRNPSHPFQVSGGLLTAASSMGQHFVRDPKTPFQSLRDRGPEPGVDALPPPTGEPLMVGVTAPPGAPVSPPPALIHAGNRPPGQARARSPQEMSTQKTLVFLAVACCVLGFTIGVAAPYMLIAAGALSLRATYLTGRAGLWSTVVGLVLIVTGVVLDPGLEALLGRLTSLTFGIWFVSAAVGRTRRDV